MRIVSLWILALDSSQTETVSGSNAIFQVGVAIRRRSFRISSGELSFGSPPLLHVMWKIPDFFKLANLPRYSTKSPEFSFADGRYCLRLYREHIVYLNFEKFKYDYFGIMLQNSNDTLPGRDILYEIVLKSITGKEIDIYRHVLTFGEVSFSVERSELEKKRDSYFPDGTLAVFCSVRLREPRSAGRSMSNKVEKLILSDFMEDCFKAANLNSGLTSGELSFESPRFWHVTWNVPNFFQLAEQSRYSLESPEFPFADCRYCLRLFPSLRLDHNCVDIKLVNLNGTVSGTDVSHDIMLKSNTGTEMFLNRIVTSIGQVSFFVVRNDLERQKESCFPDRTLTVFCSVRLREPSSTEAPKSGRAETHAFPDFKVSFSQSATLPKSSVTETSEKEEERLPSLAKLQSDYRQLLQKGEESDACLVVCGKEFRAHRCVLRARSTVFDAMFGHDTAEKNSGRVVIKDLDSESFGHFLEYLYTGRVGAGLSDDNAFGLYKAADKYEVLTLKSECVAHMRRNLSVESFCDVISVALRHQEEKLLQKAVRFFKENMARITVTVKWQQFVIDNGTAANELLIKAVVPGEK